MTRNQRRNAAAKRTLERTAKLANAALAHRNAAIVSRNLSSPIRGETSGALRSRMGDYPGQSHRGYVCRA